MGRDNGRHDGYAAHQDAARRDHVLPSVLARPVGRDDLQRFPKPSDYGLQDLPPEVGDDDGRSAMEQQAQRQTAAEDELLAMLGGTNVRSQRQQEQLYQLHQVQGSGGGVMHQQLPQHGQMLPPQHPHPHAMQKIPQEQAQYDGTSLSSSHGSHPSLSPDVRSQQPTDLQSHQNLSLHQQPYSSVSPAQNLPQQQQMPMNHMDGYQRAAEANGLTQAEFHSLLGYMLDADDFGDMLFFGQQQQQQLLHQQQQGHQSLDLESETASTQSGSRGVGGGGGDRRTSHDSSPAGAQSGYGSASNDSPSTGTELSPLQPPQGIAAHPSALIRMQQYVQDGVHSHQQQHAEDLRTSAMQHPMVSYDQSAGHLAYSQLQNGMNGQQHSQPTHAPQDWRAHPSHSQQHAGMQQNLHSHAAYDEFAAYTDAMRSRGQLHGPRYVSVLQAQGLSGDAAYAAHVSQTQPQWERNGAGAAGDGFTPYQASHLLPGHDEQHSSVKPKRKVTQVETPPSLPGAMAVPPAVAAKRHSERARGSSKLVVDIDAICTDCGTRTASVLFHGTTSIEQVLSQNSVEATCIDCNKRKAAASKGTIGGKKGTPDQEARRAEFEHTEYLQDCELCEKSVGGITIRYDGKDRPALELVCDSCDNLFAWCTQCGGGSRHRTGKWRPKSLFLAGRKTCRLRSIRLAGTTPPRIEIYDVGNPAAPLPQDVIDGCKGTFVNRFLFRFAKPKCEQPQCRPTPPTHADFPAPLTVIHDEMSFERLERVMYEWWDWIEARLREPESAMNGVVRVLGILRAQVSSAGKGKSDEDSVISYQILEWAPSQHYILLANACIALTGIASARLMLVCGKATTYRMFLKVHENVNPEDAPPGAGPAPDAPGAPLPHQRYPRHLLRLETDIDMEKVKAFIQGGWEEISRVPLAQASESSKNMWQLRTEKALMQLESGKPNKKTLITLRWVFERSMPVPPEAGVLMRVSIGKTIARPRRDDEEPNQENFPIVQWGFRPPGM